VSGGVIDGTSCQALKDQRRNEKWHGSATQERVPYSSDQTGAGAVNSTLASRTAGESENTFMAETAAEVQNALLKARAEHSQGLPVAPGLQTVEQFLTGLAREQR
jgi:hypothetical protein